MAKNIQKRLRHLRGVWERRLIKKAVLKSYKKKTEMFSRFFNPAKVESLVRLVSYKVSVLSRKYRVPKCYRRKEQQKLNG